MREKMKRLIGLVLSILVVNNQMFFAAYAADSLTDGTNGGGSTGWSDFNGGRGGSSAIVGSGSPTNTLSTSSPGYVPNSTANSLCGPTAVGTTSTGTTFSYSGPGPGAGLSDQSTAITGSGSSVNTLSTSSPGYVPNATANSLCGPTAVGTTSTGTTFCYSGPGPGAGYCDQSTAIIGSGSSVNTLSTSTPGYVNNSYSNSLANQYSHSGTTSTGTTFNYCGPGPGAGYCDQSTAIIGSGSLVNTLSTSTPGYVNNDYSNGLANQYNSSGTISTGSTFDYSGPGGSSYYNSDYGGNSSGINSIGNYTYGGNTYNSGSGIGTVSGGWGSGNIDSGTGNGVNTYSNSTNSVASTSSSVYPSGASLDSSAVSSSGYSSGSSSASNTGTPANYNTGSVSTPHCTPSTATYSGGTTANSPLAYPTSSSSSGGSLPACDASPTATFNPDY
jgi:hypothetical protein